jgi:hypothetical protein
MLALRARELAIPAMPQGLSSIDLDAQGEKPYRSTLTHASRARRFAFYTLRRSTPGKEA